MVSKKRNMPFDKIHSKKMFKADNKKNNCDDSSTAKNIRITSLNENSIEKLQESITIKDELLPVTDDSIDVDEINNSNDHSIGPVIKSNGIPNSFQVIYRICSDKVIKNDEHQKNTRTRTRSLASKKCSFCTEDDDELSFTQDYDDVERARVVKLAVENPTWSLNMLRERSGCINIRDRYQVKKWKKQIERGGTHGQKMNLMEQIKKHQLETTDQELFTDSFNFCWELLKSKEYYLSELESIKIVTAEATCDSGYDDNCDQLDQQQKQQQVDKVNIDIDNSQDKMILEKRKISVDEIHSKKMFKEDNKKNNCDDSNNAENEKKLFTKDNITTKDEIVSDDLIDVSKINNWNDHPYALDIKSNEISNFSKDNNQSYSNEVIESVGYQMNTRISTGSLAPKNYNFHIEEDYDSNKNNCDDSSNSSDIQIVSSNENSIDKLHMIDFIEKEEKLFIEESITIKDEMLPVTGDSIDVDKINNSDNQSIGQKIKSNEISNSSNNTNQSCWNKIIESVDYQKNTRLRTGSLASKKYTFHPEEDDDLSTTTDENYIYDDDDVDDELSLTKDENSLIQNKNLKDKIKIIDGISFEEKTRVVKLAIENPTWSLDMLRKHSGCKIIKQRLQIEMWKKQIQQGGSYLEKSKIETIKSVTTEATCVSGYDDNYNQFNPPQQVDKVHSQDRMISKKSKIPVDEIHSEKMFKAVSGISYEERSRVVKLASKNPNWSLHWLRERSGCEGIRQRSQVEEWKKQIQQGGSPREKMNFVVEMNDQQLFTDSFKICWELLKSREYYLCEHDTNIYSRLSLNYGQDMYDAMVIIINKIIKSNEKLKVESIKSVTAEATRNLGYDDDDYDELNQQRKQQVNKVLSRDTMISKKRNLPVDKIRSRKMFKADYKKNNCDDSSNAKNIQIVPLNENLIDKLHMIDFIKKEQESFTEHSITIKDELLSIAVDSINVDNINNLNDHSIGLKIKSNEISNFFKDNNQSYSNKVIENVEHQINTRFRTRSLAPEKYSFHTEEDDDLSFTTDENYLDNDDDDDDFYLYITKKITDHPSYAKNIQITSSNENSIEKLHMIDFIKKEEQLYNDQSCSNKGIENVEHQRQARIRTRSVASKKYSFCTKENDDLSSTTDENYIDGDNNSLNQNRNLKDKIKIIDGISFEEKTGVVRLALENPTWSLDMLRKHSGCKIIKQRLQIKMWKKQIEQGGTLRRKMNCVNNWVLNKCI
ncbi:MATH and LRR domain-containing protein PFE0570w-like [Aphidius gifuensis]|uniref:MATH and LRR domain-containing protein PFE0570w-like n=1 Tax=Aphidius gifuensis TaxID=684658 RepID=UPI001CDC6736|nr:MATH and LRR domain-containing protein PFE0570w-like [Aphidius gifuensis]